MRPQRGRKPSSSAAAATGSSCCRAQLRIGLVAVVERDAERLHLRRRPRHLGGEAVDAARPGLRGRVELEPVLAGVGQLVDADDRAGQLARAPGHAGDQAVAAGEPPQLDARAVGHARVLRPGDDRREDAVDVEEDGRAFGLGGEQGEWVHARRVGAMATAKLVGIGLVAGAFGALFGVGGGIVIVPLLVFLFAFDQRRASATSLGAILITAVAGAATYGLHGEVKPGAAAIVGLPAVAGVLIGTSAPAAGTAACAHLRLRDRAGGGRRQAARLTIVLVGLLGLAAGVLAGLFGVGGGIVFVPALDLRARPVAVARRGDVAARDPADGDRRLLAPAPLREHRSARCADRRPRLDHRRPGGRRRRPSRCPNRSCAGSSACSC